MSAAMDAEDLYGLPLERFVAERTALVKALRSRGEREEAAYVAKLAKPSVAAWAVNQLVRTQRAAIAKLFDAGDALARAQEEVIAGSGSAQELREAAERERAAVSDLTQTARGLLGPDGHGLTQTTLERVTETLHAAALEQQARARVRDGCLTRELRHVGLGDSAPADAPSGPSGPSSRPSGRRQRGDSSAGTRGRADRDRRGAERSARERAQRLEAERAERERERAKRLEAARTAEAQARRASEWATRELEAAQERRDRAAAELDEAERALSAARTRAQEAKRAHQRARSALEGSS